MNWGFRYLGRRPGDDWYLSLFPNLANRLTGQIEPSYANLPQMVIDQIARLAPDLKIVLVMRDPVDRAWSQVLKRLARGFDRPIDVVPDDAILAEFERFAVPMSSYADVLERWEKAFSPANVAQAFYDDLVREPRDFINGICGTIGAAPHPQLDAASLRSRVNDTSKYEAPIPEKHLRWLAERLLEPTRKLAVRFPDPASSWVRRMEAVLSRTSMAQPRISPCITS